MTTRKILHIFNDSKFSIPYFSFLEEQNFNLNQHTLFHFRTELKNYPCPRGMKAFHSKSFFNPFSNLKLLSQMKKADQIIVHCFASPFLLIFLSIQPALIKKCYWVIWGKDLYFYRTLNKKYPHHWLYEQLRKHVLKNIQYVITDNVGDYELARSWYGLDAKLFRSFSYPSNLYKQPQKHTTSNNTVSILLGNSADPSNKHLEVLDRLININDVDFKIFSPLSYGDLRYAKIICKEGNKRFGERFKGLEVLLPPEEYANLLNNIDIAIFAHERQQAMGNILSLLGMGKKVYIRKSISTWESLTQYGLKIFDYETLNLERISQEDAKNNQKILKSIYSKSNLKQQWANIFSS